LDSFLRQPLVARVATAGPTVRPVWFLWEDGAFWWITGSFSVLPDRLRTDPAVALVVDTYDQRSGTVLQVTVSGDALVVDMDRDRAVRKLSRYLGEDVDRWPGRFRAVLTDPDARLVKLLPRRRPRLVDMSFRPDEPPR
jgi:nitroimidazol reductase NimA-like FMN-containing flavoprotein (pyridoxamine 5'-phosphate oxidase superfamily)